MTTHKLRAEDGTLIELKVAWPEAREVPDEAAAREVYDRIVWHPGCEGRHGTIRNVQEADRDRTELGLAYFLGEGCSHWRGNDVEVVHMTKVFPPPEYPDEWCGTSVLWPK